MELRCKQHILRFGRGERTVLMGVLNVTPDSFSDGGRYQDPNSAAARAAAMVGEGADLLDVGGESSRPGAAPVSVEEELDRVLPVLERIAGLGVPISIDTCKPEVADAALRAGAHLINDISGMGEEMLAVAREHGVPVVVMHMRGTPRTMQENPVYANVVEEVAAFLAARKAAADDAGIGVMLDPGIGFGKTLEHNLELLRSLGRLRALGAPVLVGVSRKSFLGKLTAQSVEQRLETSLAAGVYALLAGADVLRVHDVAAHRHAVRVIEALRCGEREDGTRRQQAPGQEAPRQQAPGQRGARRRVLVVALPCQSRIGVSPEERLAAQELLVDLDVVPAGAGGDDLADVRGDVRGDVRADDLAETVDYERLAELARRVAGERERQLLETLAEDLAAVVLAELPLSEVRVRVVKASVSRAWGGGSFGVEVTRRR